MKTKKIVIKSTSGFCPVDYAYSDKLTITPNSIAYEYKPYLENDNSLNVYRKWSYKTTNSIFSLAFAKIAVAVDEILKRDQEAKQGVLDYAEMLEKYVYQCIMGACAENSIYEINEMLKENGITPLGSNLNLQ